MILREIGFRELHERLEKAARDTGDVDTALGGWIETEPPELFVGTEPYSLMAFVLESLGVSAAQVHELGLNNDAPSLVFPRLGFPLTRNSAELADQFWVWELRGETWADLLADFARPTYPDDTDVPASLA